MTPSIDISRFRKMGKDNLEFLSSALESTLSAFSGYGEQLEEVLGKRDPEALDALSHKMTMSMYYVQAEGLGRLFNDYGILLREVPRDDEKLAVKEKEIIQEIEKIKVELKELISNPGMDVQTH